MRRILPLLIFATLSCTGDSGAPPNLVLVTVDTLRPDHLSPYGKARVATPNVERLAAEGTLFENALSDSPWTTPSMASVMTGLYPTRHGFKSTNTDRLSDAHETLAERLRAAGFTTAAVIGSFPLDSIYHLDQGFDSYDDAFTAPIWIHPDVTPAPLPSVFHPAPEDQAMFTMAKAMNDSRRSDAEVTDAALAWLATAGPEPFFLWVHYFGPHGKPDWRIPETARLAHQLASYPADVGIFDTAFGRLLDGLDASGLTDRTLLVLHADHAESLGENQYVGHGKLLNEATMRVPLLLRWPGRVAAGRRVEALVRNVDIHPTLLEAAGVGIPEDLSGASLLGLADASAAATVRGWLTDEDPRSVYMETWYPAHAAYATTVEAEGRSYRLGVIRRGVRDGRWLLVRSEPHPLLDVGDPAWDEIPEPVRESLRAERLYDLGASAHRSRDVAAAHPDVSERLSSVLERHLAREGERAPPLDTDPATRLRLESLGYGR